MISVTPISRTARLLFVFCCLAAACAGCSKGGPTKDGVFSRANEALAANQLRKAEEGYREVLASAPEDPTALRQLGMLYLDQGQFPQAYPLLKKAAELQPDDAQVQLDLGFVLLAFGQLAQARDAARQVLEKEPGLEGALLLLTRSVESDDDLAEARKFIESLRGQDSDRAAYHVAIGRFDLREKNPAGAEREFKAALDLDSTSSGAYVGLGLLYWKRNDLPAADQAFQKAVELSPPRSATRIGYLDFLIRTASDAAKGLLKEITAKYPDYLPPRVAAMDMACGERWDDDCASRRSRSLHNLIQ